jgi:hypothetical protein
MQPPMSNSSMHHPKLFKVKPMIRVISSRELLSRVCRIRVGLNMVQPERVRRMLRQLYEH